jgi:hypothetical protein
MNKQIIPINEKYRIEFDHPNYTLQVSYFSKKDNEIKWLNEGYYSSIVSAVKKFIELDSLFQFVSLHKKCMTVSEYTSGRIAAVDQAVAKEIASVIASAKRW